jgi:hypothetical protein
MRELTIITHVYNAQAGLDHQVALWQQLDATLRERLSFIVIDDFSDPPLTVDRSGPALDLRLLRVRDDIDWNMPGCRNLAAVQANSDWLLFFDIDNVLSPEDLTKVLLALARLDRTVRYVFRRTLDGQEVEPHLNSFLVSRWGFLRAGGYDEDFCGHYGYEDVLFRNMWRKYVGSEVLLTDVAFQQKGWKTAGLDRDVVRNQTLLHTLAAQGFPKPKGMLRFDWSEVD